MSSIDNKSLDYFGKLFNTDKATYHEFTKFYDDIINLRKDKIRNILEIGIYNGASLKMFHSYFNSHVNIHAIDINLSGDPHLNTVKCVYGDQNDTTSLKKSVELLGNKVYDIIIDDGSHISTHQRNSLQVMWQSIIPGGMYIIEDLHTNIKEWYPKSPHYYNESPTLYEDIIMYMSGKKCNLPVDIDSIDKCILLSRVKTTSMTCVLYKKNELQTMPKFISTRDTLTTCMDFIKNNKRGMYLRYGDGDYNIVRGIPDMLCRPTENFIKWMKISMSIREDAVMTCIPHHCKELNTIEEGICPGNHEYGSKQVLSYVKILNTYSPLPNKIYSNIALSYCSSHDPDYVIDMHNILKTKNIVFFGNKTYSDDFLKVLFGEKIHRIDTNQRDSYLDHDNVMNNFDMVYNNYLINYEYFVIIIAAGCGGRAYSAELYMKYNTCFFIFDYGSLLDYLAGQNTRDYMGIDPPKQEYILNKL